MRFIFGLLLFLTLLTSLNSHEPPTTEAPHEDFDPVIEFPDASSDYKLVDRNGSFSSPWDENHHQMHSVVNSIIHKENQVQETLRKMKDDLRNKMSGKK